MRFTLILFLFIQCPVFFAQCDTTSFIEFPDVEAKFPGGTAKMMRFIQKNIEYPETLDRDEVPGRIRFIFFVCADGSVIPDYSSQWNNDTFEKTKIDLIRKMPNWVPAQVNDINVTTKVMINLNINLE